MSMKIGVIGAGAWGTAFAIHLARQGHQVLLWVYEQELFDVLNKTRENTLYLPSFILQKQINFTYNLEELVNFSHDIVVAVPSFALRKTIEKVSGLLSTKHLLILTKGFEEKTLLRMSEVVSKVTGNKDSIAVLSGPSFAKEVAQGVFTSVVISSNTETIARYFQNITHCQNFRVYTGEDVIGLEVGSALKNVMAIGAGIIEGLRLGTNTQAAFITRGLAEIKRLGKALGAKDATFLGLSGIGDLILTSYGGLSRNRAFGIELAKGRRPEEIIASQQQVVEGYYTINAAYMLSKRMAVEMPITEELYKILYQGKDLLASFADIKKRSFKEEES
jgi:glycerol-3-phosphate dehydrogenase (NAD(P)+)